MKRFCIITAACLMAAFAFGAPAQESGTVTNGTFTYTVTATYSLRYLEQVEVTYNSAVSETVTIQTVKGSITNTVLTQALSSNTSLLYLPDKDVNLGPVGTVWRVTAPSSGSVPATIKFIINDDK